MTDDNTNNSQSQSQQETNDSNNNKDEKNFITIHIQGIIVIVMAQHADGDDAMLGRFCLHYLVTVLYAVEHGFTRRKD
jgi:hypothetical protein